jgi:hypothetical protein
MTFPKNDRYGKKKCGLRQLCLNKQVFFILRLYRINFFYSQNGGKELGIKMCLTKFLKHALMCSIFIGMDRFLHAWYVLGELITCFVLITRELSCLVQVAIWSLEMLLCGQSTDYGIWKSPKVSVTDDLTSETWWFFLNKEIITQQQNVHALVCGLLKYFPQWEKGYPSTKKLLDLRKQIQALGFEWVKCQNY